MSDQTVTNDLEIPERPDSEPEPEITEPTPERPDTEIESDGAGAIDQHNKEMQEAAALNEERNRKEEIEKAQRDLEALAPTTDAVRWVIGKPPEHGGKDKQYGVYVQEKLPWMPRAKFFSLVSRTIAESVRAGGGSLGSMSDVFNDPDGGSFMERGQRWTQRDFGDLGSFVTTILELIGYSDEFMLEAYCIWLNVPRQEKKFAKELFNQSWAPDADPPRFGLRDEDHEKIINTFIDQNYEEIRRFFVETLPSILKRASLHERSKERKPLVAAVVSDQ